MCLFAAHGTFIGSFRLEHNKPQQLFVDSEIKFGASTRSYIIRERPQQNNKNLTTLIQSEDKNESDENNAYGLPESEAELDVICVEISNKSEIFHDYFI